MIHRIHLKGPWDFTALDSTASGPADTPTSAQGTAKFPVDWQTILGDYRGSARFTRHFNRPTNLDDWERVDLVLDGIGGAAEVKLNQQVIGAVGPPDQTARIDVSRSLLPHNVLEITITWHGTAPELGGLWAPVALEIHS